MPMTVQNVLQEEYLKPLKKDIQKGIIKIEDSAFYFDILQSQFPTTGSGIAWSKIPEHIFIDMSGFQSDKTAYMRILKESWQKVKSTLQSNPNEDVIIIGDGVLDVALRLPLHKVEELYAATFALPQHSYILPIDASWCINYTFEDELFFGRHE